MDRLENEIKSVKDRVGQMGQHLNGAIERINSLHQALKELAKDLEYDETMSNGDEEFDLEDKDEGFQTEGKIKKQ